MLRDITPVIPICINGEFLDHLRVEVSAAAETLQKYLNGSAGDIAEPELIPLLESLITLGEVKALLECLRLGVQYQEEVNQNVRATQPSQPIVATIPTWWPAPPAPAEPVESERFEVTCRGGPGAAGSAPASTTPGAEAASLGRPPGPDIR